MKKTKYTPEIRDRAVQLLIESEKDYPSTWAAITAIAVLSAWNTLDVIYKALNVGATGYVLKETDDFELMFAIRTMLKGGAIIDPNIAKKILSKFKKSLIDLPVSHEQVHTSLSQRETEILTCVSNGLSSREIGLELNISKYIRPLAKVKTTSI